jgi:hypothetical protein
MYLREAVKSSTEKNLKNFKKRLDKLLKVCYNNNVLRDRARVRNPTASAVKKIKKVSKTP